MGAFLDTCPTQDLHQALGIFDEIICKAVAVDPFTQLALAERRMRDRMLAAHRKAAKKADQWLLAKARKNPNPKKVKGWMPGYVRFFTDLAPEFEEPIAELAYQAIKAGKAAVYSRALGTKGRPIYTGPPFESRVTKFEVWIEEVEKAAAAAFIDIQPSFSLVDADAVDKLSKANTFWVGKYHSKTVRDSIEVATSKILGSGLPPKEAGAKLQELLGAYHGYAPVPTPVPIPIGWTGTPTEYFAGVAANAATVSRIHGSISAMQEVGISKYEVLNPIDERTCTVCEEMNGVIIDVKIAFQHMEVLEAAPDPSAVKDIKPWFSTKEFMSRMPSYKKAPDGTKSLTGKAMGKLVDSGMGYPPFHFKCRCSVDIVPETISEPVSIPTSIKAPPKAERIRPRKPKGKPKRLIPEIIHPTGPTTYDNATLSSAWDAAAGAEFPAKPAQLMIRKQLNSLVYGETKMVPLDSLSYSSGASVVHFPSKMPGAFGTHNVLTGKIRIKLGQYKKAKRFLAKNGKKATLDEIHGFKTVVHESVHGCSPQTGFAYESAGKVIEEVTTEMAARRVMTSRWGIQVKQFSSGYDPWIRDVSSFLREAADEVLEKYQLHIRSPQVQEMLSDASVKMRIKPLKWDQRFRTSDAYAKHFSEQLTLPTEVLDSISASERTKAIKAFQKRVRAGFKNMNKEIITKSTF